MKHETKWIQNVVTLGLFSTVAWVVYSAWRGAENRRAFQARDDLVAQEGTGENWLH
jgi:hypothetical protein